MAGILQITTPIAPKDYSLPQKSQLQTEQIFNIADTTKINQSNARHDDFAQEDLKDSKMQMPKSQTFISKNGSSTSDALRSIIGEDALNRIKDSGDKELLNKITKFADEIMRSPDNLTQDIIDQQNNSTIFNNSFFKNLAGLYNNSTQEISNAVTELIKASASANSQAEIMNSISANLRFLASSLAQSRDLSSQLMDIANNLSASNFSSMKSQIQQLLENVSESLLLNDKTQNLIPLVTYNLSRVAPEDQLANSFDNLLSLLQDNDTKQDLIKSFTDFVSQSAMSAKAKDATLQNLTDTSAYKATLSLAENAGKLTQGMNPAELSRMLSGINANRGSYSLRTILSLIISDNNRGNLETVMKSFESSRDLNSLVDKLSTIINSIDNLDIKIPLAQRLNEVLDNMSKMGGVRYKAPTSMESFADFLSKNINDATMKFVGNINPNELASGLLSSPGVFSPLLHFLVPLEADGLRGYGELWADPQADDVIKDKKSSKNESDEPGNHIFMCFDVEDTGYFELEIISKNNNLNILLLCPENLTKAFEPLKNTIPEIARSNGFTVNSATVDAVVKRRELNEIFPKLNEKRFDLNVKI